jgi:hypothetical protein
MTAPEHLPTQDLLAIGIRLARTQFPGLRNVIDELLRRDENFRDMCEELADLEEAIASADTFGIAKNGTASRILSGSEVERRDMEARDRPVPPARP